MNNWIKKNDANLCTAGGIICLVGAVVNTAFATTKSIYTVQDIEAQINRKLTKKEVFKCTWKYWVAPAAEVVGGIALTITGNRLSNAKQVALAAAVTTAETTLQLTQTKMPEIVGDKAAQKLKEAVAEEITKEVIEESEKKGIEPITIIKEGEEGTKFVEPYTRQVFISTWDNVRKACNEINRQALNKVSNAIDPESVAVTINDWLEMLGLHPVEPEVGEDIGWRVGKDQLLEISLSATVIKDEPVGEIFYETRPKYLY